MNWRSLCFSGAPPEESADELEAGCLHDGLRLEAAATVRLVG